MIVIEEKTRNFKPKPIKFPRNYKYTAEWMMLYLFFKNIVGPTRRGIIETILAQGPLNAFKIAKIIKMSYNAVRVALRVINEKIEGVLLKENGDSDSSGKYDIRYRVSREKFDIVMYNRLKMIVTGNFEYLAEPFKKFGRRILREYYSMHGGLTPLAYQ